LLIVEPLKGDFDFIEDTAIVKSSVIHENLNIPDFDNESFWTYGNKDLIMRKIPDSPYNTDNAWEVHTYIHFHDADRTLPNAFTADEIIDDTSESGAESDDDKTVLKWVDMNNHTVVDKTMVDALNQVVEKHGTNERQKTSLTVEQVAEKMGKVEAQYSIIESMDGKLETLKSHHSTMEQIVNKRTEITTCDGTTIGR
jgi:hypothetical protein